MTSAPSLPLASRDSGNVLRCLPGEPYPLKASPLATSLRDALTERSRKRFGRSLLVVNPPGAVDHLVEPFGPTYGLVAEQGPEPC